MAAREDADPYRWLEDSASPETAAWVTAQNRLTQAYLARVPARDAIRSRLTERWDFARSGVPFERGGRWFAVRNPERQDQPVLCVMDAPDAEGRVLLDPNVLAADGTVAVSAISVSPDGSKVAYATSASGSDWLTWRVRDVASAADLGDTLNWCKSASAEWEQDGSGFYYAAMTPPQLGREYREASGTVRIFFHRAGPPQRADELVFAPADAALYPKVTASADGRYLILSLSRGTGPGAELRWLDLRRRAAGWRVLVPAGDRLAEVIASEGTTFYLLTDDGADKRRIVAIDSAAPHPPGPPREVVPAAGDTLLEAHFSGGRLVCHYLHEACSRLRVLGGGEYGRAWHDAGKLANKQNVFDDFCACARWLASSGWSRADRIAINGGSNGGLLVGACLTQHPELSGAAVADVGVFDMLRFHHFTVGWRWMTEYGDPEDPGQYRWLRRYSPLHNVRPGHYPATLLTTGDHDDRVVPGHSFKFAALQQAQRGGAPIPLRVKASAGHSHGKPAAKAIAEAADRLAFIERALKMNPLPPQVSGPEHAGGDAEDEKGSTAPGPQ